MRWTVLSIVTAIVLIVAGFFVVGGDNLNIAEKATYWLCVFGFVTAESLHLLKWVREHDL